MKRGLKWFALVLSISIIFFCAAYMVTVHWVIEPRHAYLTDEGVLAEIEDLKSIVLEKEREIIALEDELERTQSMLEQFQSLESGEDLEEDE